MGDCYRGSSIASSLLGAKENFAYDLDDVAVRVAHGNIELNPGMENIHVAAGDLLKGVEIEADGLWLISWRISSFI